jgi:SagB-type dehydrogenase family enzyme
MTWIDLGEPSPRDAPSIYTPFSWPPGEAIYLNSEPNLPKRNFSEVALSRRSARTFEDVNFEQLSTLFTLSCRVQQLGHRNYGFPQSYRPAPSAGAIHPVHILLSPRSKPEWWRYDSNDHCLVSIDFNADALMHVNGQIQRALPGSNGLILFFVAEPGKTFAKYIDACSLIWRDAGVLLGQLALTSEAMRLNFCPIGITGNKWASMLDPQGRLVGVGAALLGSRR